MSCRNLADASFAVNITCSYLCKLVHVGFMIKFADDSVIVSLLRDHEVDRGPAPDYFLRWCDDSQLNVSKTKDTILDFRKNPPV